MAEYDYSYTISGVGTVRDYLGPRADAQTPAKLYATQCAVFTAKFANEPERSPRSPRPMPLPFYPAQPGSAHILRTTHIYPVAQAPTLVSLRKIRKLAKELMLDRMQTGRCSLRDLWSRRGIRTACGGELNKVVEALREAPDTEPWDIDIDPEATLGIDALQVIYRGYIPPVREAETVPVKLSWPTDGVFSRTGWNGEDEVTAVAPTVSSAGGWGD